MLLHEVCKQTGLTRKAVEYYVEQKLISPSPSENGYRNFSASDVTALQKIALLRRLGIGTEDIRAVLADPSGNTLQALAVRGALNAQREQVRQQALSHLCRGADDAEVLSALNVIDQSETITEKLLLAFPGHYGRFICLHFARFLNVPLETDAQKAAYQTVLDFLDRVPTLRIPPELADYLDQGTKHLTVQDIVQMQQTVSDAYRHPAAFLEENKDALDVYLACKQSDEYRNSPACKLQTLLQDFQRTSGYLDVFLPAMKLLSPSYADYSAAMEQANEQLLAQYPDIARFADAGKDDK